MACSGLESISCWGKSFTSVAPEVSPADGAASEIVGASKTLPGTLGLWPFFVGAAPCDASATSEGLLATQILEDARSTWSAEDTELVESAA